MNTSPDCPDRQQLQQLLDGVLPEPEQSALSAHLDGCPACQQTVEGLAAGRDTWMGAAERLAHSPQQPDPALSDALEQARRAGQSGATILESNRPAEFSLDFLLPPDQPGHLGKLGHYEIFEVVGRGAFGIVLRAFDQKLQRVVAIKVLSPHLATNGSARRRFIRESQAAAAVCHEHVVTIHAVEEENNPPFLVMQYIAGVSLQERIDRTGPLRLREILRIGMQAAQGLAAAHAQGLVHRDIKPSNILLENGVERVKITDFGLARAVDDASLTQTGVIAGTPQYMAPEQARGEPVDHRADLFSLGSVLYALCTGHPPFRASTTLAVMKRVCEETPRPIRDVNPEIPDWLAGIVNRLLAKNPADRFGTAQEVAALLGQQLAHLQSPDRVAISAGTFSLTPHAVSSPRPAVAAASPNPAMAPVKARRILPWIIAACLLLLIVPLVLVIGAAGWYFSAATRSREQSIVSLQTAAKNATAASLDYPVEFTNSIDMKLRLISAVVVNGADSADFNDIVNRDREKKQTRITKLKAYLVKVQDDLADQRKKLRILTDAGGSGDLHSLSVIQKTLLDRVDKYQNRVLETQLSLIELREEYNLLTGSVAAPEAPAKLSDAEIDAQIRNDPTWNKIDDERKRIVTHIETLKRDLPESKHAKLLEKPLARLKVLEGQLAAGRTAFVEFLSKPAAVDHTLEQLSRNIELLERTSTKLSEGLKKAQDDAKAAGLTSLEVELVRDEIQKLKEMVDTVWAEVKRSEIELPNESETNSGRIDLIGKARLPREFDMGTPLEEIDKIAALLTDDWQKAMVRNEWPHRHVRIAEPFYLGATEITVGQFRAFVEATRYQTTAETNGKGGRHPVAGTIVTDPEWTWRHAECAPSEQHPVVQVSLTDAKEFCSWLSEREGRDYLVPTEEQWEFACRAGTNTRWFSGDDENALAEYAWMQPNAPGVQPVARKRANPFGLFDVHGNVEECCRMTDGVAVSRGGHVDLPALLCRSAVRFPIPADEVWSRRGFRVACRVATSDEAPSGSGAVLKLERLVTLAEEKVQRLRLLRENQSVSASEVTQAEMDWKNARVRLATAQGDTALVVRLLEEIVALREGELETLQTLVEANSVPRSEAADYETLLIEDRLRLEEARGRDDK